MDIARWCIAYSASPCNTGMIMTLLNKCRSIGSSPLANGAGPLTVGGVASGNFFSGTLQDVRIYSAALSDRYNT